MLPGPKKSGSKKYWARIEEHNFNALWVGYDYAETLGLELVKGQDFEEGHTSAPDKAVIVNETLVKFMGWEDPIGKRITRPNGFQAKVVGVVKDFNFRSLHNATEPLLIRMQRQPGGMKVLAIFTAYFL
jgi:putative ABC transport system permease protein